MEIYDVAEYCFKNWEEVVLLGSLLSIGVGLAYQNYKSFRRISREDMDICSEKVKKIRRRINSPDVLNDKLFK